MTNRDLEKKLRSAFEHAAPDRFDAVSCSAPLEKGSVKVMQPAKKNRYIARFAALAAALVLVAGAGYGVRSNFRPEMPTFSADTGNAQLPAEPENAAPAAPTPATPAVPDAPEQPEDPVTPVVPDEQTTPAAPVIPMAPPVPGPAPDPQIKIAFDLARTDAGVEESEVESFTVRDIDEQTNIVDLEFYTSAEKYRYRVNVNAAVADQVMKIISGSRALETAFAHAGVDPMNTKVTQMLLHDLAEPVHYGYTFIYDGCEYVYEIDAATGEVLKADKKEYTAPAEPQLPTIPSKPVEINPVTTLTANEIIGIACGHAGVPSDQIGPMELTMDDDEAVRHYDLKFQYEGAVYFYEIEASNGEILTWQKSAYGGTEFVAPPSVPYPPTPAVPVNPVVPVPTPAPI